MRYTTTFFIAICCLLSFGAKAQTEATFYTSMGNFVVTFTDDKTPITVDSMLSRISSKFYDGILFHRVIKDFMIQGGDPNGNGTGGPGYTIPDEFDASLSNVQASISMANTGQANSGGSQFFINLKDNTGLDFNKQPLSSKHAVFGMVTSGFSVVQAIGNVSTTGSTGNPKNKPLTDVVMDSVRITKFPTGIGNTNKLDNIATVYPNPTNGELTIKLAQPNAVNKVILTDIKGTVVNRMEVEYVDYVRIDLSQKAKGIYLLQVTNANSTYRSKVWVR